MKILSVPQIREADAYTIAHEPVASIDLMERAAQACTDWIRANADPAAQFVIVCGNGNNGGDGLAIARMLREQSTHEVTVFTCKLSPKASPDFTASLERLNDSDGDAVELSDVHELLVFPFDPAKHIIIDALFGSGLNRKAEGLASEIIRTLNNSGCKIIAIDLPSGLFGDDNSGNDYKSVIRASVTLTFQAPKLSFMFAENGLFTGDFRVLDIGLHPGFLEQLKTPYQFVNTALVLGLYDPRPKFAHKGTFGHALLIAGSRGKIGAAVLAASAAVHAGAGLVTAQVPRCGYTILQTAVPSAMTADSREEDWIAGPPPKGHFNAVGAGPGIGTETDTQQALKMLIQDAPAPLVLDADALNILSENKTWLAFLPHDTILTPHPGEFDRLTEKHSSAYARMMTQREFAVRFGVYVVLKGAYTSIACPDGSVYFNSTGNPGMATGGSGDVLTGIITALRAQGYPPADACVLGVWMHGAAADLYCLQRGEESLSAEALVENLGGVFHYLGKQFKESQQRLLNPRG